MFYWLYLTFASTHYVPILNLLKYQTFRTGLAIFNVFLNFFHLGVWFACLWLLMRFTWTQALGLAVALWIGVTLFAVPALLAKSEAVGKARAQVVAGEKR